MSAKDYDQDAKRKDQDANRDPITGEPRSHPIGTGVGAVAGGAAAGAATGTFAGPIGTAVGAGIGAVAGGLAGKAAGEKFNPTEAGEMHRFIDYTVVDRENSKVGGVDAVWADHSGQPAYLAVRTGWLGFGKAHVVPAQRAEVNERNRTVRLPFTSEEIKNAPSFDSQDDITEENEFTISSHYGIGRDWNRPMRSPEERVDEEQLRAVGAEQTQLDEEARLRLNEETVQVGKREVEAGGVRLRKVVRTETVNVPVELTREEIRIERTPASGEDPAAAIDPAGTVGEQDIFIPLRREEAVIEKSVRAREDVRVTKRREVDRENVREEVRHEDMSVEHEGGAPGRTRP